VFTLFGKKLLAHRIIETTNEPVKYSREDKGTTCQKYVVFACYFIFILSFIINQSMFKIPPTAIGMALIPVMYIFKALPMEKILSPINIDMMLQCGVILAFVNIMSSSGAIDLIANPLISLLGRNITPLAICAILYITAAILTQFMINQYVTLMLFPLCISFSEAADLNPIGLVLTVLMASSICFCSPTGTVGNMVIFHEGKLKFNDYLLPGIICVVIGMIVNLTIIPIVYF
jgi:di/tricarboxylate transporter